MSMSNQLVLVNDEQTKHLPADGWLLASSKLSKTFRVASYLMISSLLKRRPNLDDA